MQVQFAYISGWAAFKNCSENSHGKDLNGVAIDYQLAVLSLHSALELAVGGVVLEQVGLQTRIQSTHGFIQKAAFWSIA